MNSPNASAWTRRDALLAATGLSGLLLDAGWANLAHAQGEKYKTHPLHLIAETLADTVIPQTDTPGAAAANVGGFLLFALERGMGDLSLDLLTRVQGVLDQLAGESFLAATPALRLQMLSDLDRKSYEAHNADEMSVEDAWKRIKSVIVAGYYTSEIGAAKELVYEPVPGRFANILLTPEFRSRSNDVQGGTL